MQKLFNYIKSYYVDIVLFYLISSGNWCVPKCPYVIVLLYIRCTVSLFQRQGHNHKSILLLLSLVV